MSRTKELLYLFALLCLVFITNCLHYLLSHNSLTVNPDAFYFDWLSRQPSIPILHSGLAWPIHYLSTFGIVALPPLCAALAALIIYFSAKHIFSSIPIALCSVLCFAIARPVLLLTCAGNIDRDCLTLLLITCGMFIYYFSTSLRSLPLLILITALLYIESTWLSVAILAHTIFSCWLVNELVVKDHSKRQVSIAYFCILGISSIVFLVSSHQSLDILNYISNYSHTGELKPLTIIDLCLWIFLAIPIYFGFLSMSQKTSDRKPFFFLLIWILSSILAGLLAKRLALYMAPAVTIIAGHGLWFIFSSERAKNSTTRCLRAISVFLIFISFLSAAKLPSVYEVNSDWKAASVWIKENTPEEARLTCWWDYGHMLRDLTDRDVSVDNANHNKESDSSVALIFTTDNSEQALSTLYDFKSGYLIFTRSECSILPIIKSLSPVSYTPDSLYAQFLMGENLSGFTNVYSNRTICIFQPNTY